MRSGVDDGISRWALRLGYVAFLAPPLLVLWTAWRRTWSEGEVDPGTVLTLILGVGLVAVLLTPRWRGAAEEIAAALFIRASFLVWAPLALLAAVLSMESSSSWSVAPWSFLALLGLASVIHVASRSWALLVRKSVILVSYALFFAGADWFLGRSVIPRRSHNKIFVVHDPVLGWKLRPGFSVERFGEGYTSVESVNSLGFRSPELPFEKPPGVRRILFLGDSHTEGYTVDDDETFTRLIDDALGETVQVVSIGVGGYSTDQEMLAYLEYGRRFEPDLVVLQFDENDVAHNALESYWRGRKPYYVAIGDTLQLRGVPVPDRVSSGLLRREFLRRSKVFLFFEANVRELAVKKQIEEVDEERAWEMTERLIRELKGVVENDGAGFFFLSVEPDQPPEGRLGAILERSNIPVLDIGPAYEGVFDRIWVDEHWNEEGQRRVADVLVPQLRLALTRLEPAGSGAKPIESSLRHPR